MQKDKLLYRRIFLISIVLLLLNDFYLKDQFHNFLTGKISDFVGLFAFAYFFSYLFQKNKLLIHILSGLFFTFWKSNLSQFLIDFINSFGISCNRVVDYSDLSAIVILPISYFYSVKKNDDIVIIKILPKQLIIAICFFSFLATSTSRRSENLHLKSDFYIVLEISKAEILNQMQAYETAENNYRTRLVLDNPNAHIDISFRIYENLNNSTTIELNEIDRFYILDNLKDSIYNEKVKQVRQLEIDDFEKLFIKQVINEK